MFTGRDGIDNGCHELNMHAGLGCFAEEQWQKDFHHNMRSSSEGAERGTPPKGFAPYRARPDRLLKVVLDMLDAAKAEDVAVIDLRGKTSIGDQMVIASGRSQRHVGAVADK